MGAVDASAIARVLGILVEPKALGGTRAKYLPQRIAVFAQGSTSVTFSTTKFRATSAVQVGNKLGHGCPAHLIARELFPENGDGVGTVEVTFYPLADDGSGAAATGSITPSGTATKAMSYRAWISGIPSLPFVIPAGALATAANLDVACRRIGEAIDGVPYMPVEASYTYGTVTAGALSGTGNGTCTSLSVTGSPLPGVYTLTVITAATHGGVWRLTDPNGTVISSSLTMVGGTGAATVFNVGGIQFTITDGSTDFGLGATFLITVPATNVTLTSKWKGVSANDIYVEMVADESVGLSFAVVQPTGGLVNPDVTSALNQVGGVWETMALNAMNIEDTTTLDRFQTFGDGRWGVLQKNPIVVFTGNTEPDRNLAMVTCAERRTDKINSQLVAPGSPNLPCVVAARQLARIAVVANNNPPTDYGAERITGITPGTDGQQWDYAARDAALKEGSSTVEVADQVVTIGDVVTFYRPDGDPNPAYRYVVDIVKLQNVIFNVNATFASKAWAAAPLVPDDQAVENPNARQPKAAKAAIGKLLDDLGAEAIISDPKASKKLVTATISATNAKRLDMVVPIMLSGNTNVKSVEIPFSFFFGQAA